MEEFAPWLLCSALGKWSEIPYDLMIDSDEAQQG
jgi:hypothetical protein